MILTKSDKLKSDKRDTIIDQYKEKCVEALGIVRKRMFVVENYTEKEWRDDMTMTKCPEKEKQVLTALLHILQGANIPDWVKQLQN